MTRGRSFRFLPLVIFLQSVFFAALAKAVIFLHLLVVLGQSPFACLFVE